MLSLYRSYTFDKLYLVLVFALTLLPIFRVCIPWLLTYTIPGLFYNVVSELRILHFDRGQMFYRLYRKTY